MSSRPAWVLLIGSLFGWLASVVLTVEKFKMYTEAGYVPSCNISAVLACGSVMRTEQASEFGFPNPLIGIVGFSVAVTIAVLAVAGIGLPNWFWSGLWLGLSLGLVFIVWLIFQALYRIGALCPYCMVVWAATPVLWAVVTDQLWSRAKPPLRVLSEWRWTLVSLWYAVVILLVFLKFQDYWLSLV